MQVEPQVPALLDFSAYSCQTVLLEVPFATCLLLVCSNCDLSSAAKASCMLSSAKDLVSLQVDGDWRYDARKSIMLWSIDIIDASNRTGSLEFVVPNERPEAFFPVTVNFNANKTLCQACRHLCVAVPQ